MPNIPTYDTNKVAPGQLPSLDYGSASNPFASIGQGLDRLASGAEQYYDKESRLAAADAANKRDAELQALKLKAAQDNGLDAFQNVGKHRDEAKAIVDKYSAGLNERASQYYSQSSKPAELAVVGDLNLHAANEKTKADTSIRQVRLSSLQTMGVNSPQDPRIQKAADDEATSLIDEQIAHIYGADNPERKALTEEGVKQWKSDKHSRIVDNYLSTQSPISAAAAKQYFDAHRDEIAPDKRADLEGRLQKNIAANDGMAMAQNLTLKWDSEMQDALRKGDSSGMQQSIIETSKTIKDPETQRQFLAFANEQMNMRVRLSNEQAQQRISNYISQIQKDNYVSPTVEAQLLQEEPTLQKHVRDFVSSGFIIKDDPSFMQDVNTRAGEAKTTAELDTLLTEVSAARGKMTDKTRENFLTAVNLKKAGLEGQAVEAGSFDYAWKNTFKDRVDSWTADIIADRSAKGKWTPEQRKASTTLLTNQMQTLLREGWARADAEARKDPKAARTSDDVLLQQAVETATSTVSVSTGTGWVEGAKDVTPEQAALWKIDPKQNVAKAPVPAGVDYPSFKNELLSRIGTTRGDTIVDRAYLNSMAGSTENVEKVRLDLATRNGVPAWKITPRQLADEVFKQYERNRPKATSGGAATETGDTPGFSMFPF